MTYITINPHSHVLLCIVKTATHPFYVSVNVQGEIKQKLESLEHTQGIPGGIRLVLPA